MSRPRQSLHRISAVLASAALAISGLALTAGTAGAAPPPPDCPATGSNAIYVRYLYVEALGRCPDDGGLTYWTGMLDNGMTRSQLASVFVWSPEILGGNVFRFYGDILHRTPTGPEIGAGIAMMKKDVADLELSLLASDDYYGTFSNVTDWLTSLYPAILEGRAADSGGLAYFGAMLGTNPSLATRTKVVAAIEHSAEEARFWVDCSYGAGLGRMESESEAQGWVTWLMGPGHFDTQRMWAFFLASPEAQAFANTQPNPEGLT